MRRLILAPLALLAYASIPAAVPAQSVAGCGTAAVPKADQRDRAKLETQVACFEKAGGIADAAVKARQVLIAALTPAPTPTPTAWKDCAAEGATCRVSDTAQVRIRFGGNGRFAERLMTGSIACTNAAFGGDPAPGVLKSCQTTGTVIGAPTPAPTATAAPVDVPVAEAGWARCAGEGGQCLLTYDTKARFGAPGQWQYADVRAGQLGCGAGPGWGGGDPAPGKAKVCDYVPRTGLEAPLAVARGMAVGVNVSHPSYYAGQPVFANLMTGEKWRSLTDWEPRRAQVVDNVDNLHLAPGERAAKNLTIPVGVLKGENTPIVCTWDGKASIDIGGQRTPVTYGANKATFTYVTSPTTRGELVWFTVSAQDQSDPIRNIDCREASLPRDVLFHPAVIADLKPFKVLRFLDWSAANSNPAMVTWEGRTRPESGNQAEGPTGPAIELAARLAVTVGADSWYTIPWNASADYHRQAALALKAIIPANLKIYVENSNEVWNWTFLATHQAFAEGTAEGLSTNGAEAVVLRYAEKTREVMAIWSEVFADRPGQLVRVGAFQFGAGSIETGLGKGKLADSIDAVAVAPYIGNDIVALNPGATDPAVYFTALRKDIVDRKATLYAIKNVLRRYGKPLVAYEAGQHITGGDINVIRTVQRSPEMRGIYSDYLAMWRTDVNDLIAHYTDTGPISTYGSWGAQEYTGQPLSEAPKRQALLEAAR